MSRDPNRPSYSFKRRISLSRLLAMGSAGLLLLFNSCGGLGSNSNEPTVVLFTMPYSRAFTGVQALTICVQAVRIKSEVTDSDEGTIYVPHKDLVIETQDTNLAAITIPKGSYKRVDLELGKSCASGQSLVAQNGSGQISTDDVITLTFDGNFSVEGDMELGLELAVFLNELGSTVSGTQLRTRLEALIGTLHP